MRLMNFSTTFNAFAWQTIQVEDMVGAYLNGAWEYQEEPVLRTIKAIPLAMKPEELELYQEGSASTAGITLTTNAELYFADLLADTQELRQSFVLYQGWRWKVMGQNLMLGNVRNLAIYSAVRFIR